MALLLLVVELRSRSMEPDPEVPVTRATSRDGGGVQPAAGREGHLEPPLKTTPPPLSVSLPNLPLLPLPPPLLPACLSAPPAGPTPRPGLDRYYGGSAPPSRDLTAHCQGAPPPHPPLCRSKTLLPLLAPDQQVPVLN